MSGPEVEVVPLLAGELAIPRAYAFRPPGGPLARVGAVVRPRGEPLCAPCLAYVVRHPEAGPIVVDTGLHPRAIESVRADYGMPASLIFRGLRPAGEPFDEQLRGAGVDPDAVERVVMTHLHVDHTSGMRLLPRAEFVVARAEWAAATGRRAPFAGYVAGHLPPRERVALVEPSEPHGPFSRTLDLLGDGSVRLVATPGHTPGHMSLVLRAAGGRTVAIVGDAVYTLEQLRERALPLFTAGDGAYLRSLDELAAFAAAEPDAVLVPTHDPDAWRALAGAAAAR